NINNFISMARLKIIQKILLIGSLVILLSVFMILFITSPIKRLTQYAIKVRKGKKTRLPRLDKTEIGDMGRAFENMRKALENRKYVENYVQTLTHEIKSPVSAIKGAAELLEENMPKAQQQRFLENIRTESDRIKMLVDRLLELSGLENMQSLEKAESVKFNDLLKEVIEWVGPALSNRQISLETKIQDNVSVNAEPFLLKQAVSNLLQNSIDFSSPKDIITICLKYADHSLVLDIMDQGPGIPLYAQNKIFKKFFSLQRPDTGKKSTGLGLNFVKEVANLHHGAIELKNLPEKGACATLILPAFPT
ncbi:MAG: two-component system sensor histidine kinase CreC, partial [Desulfobacteraceae bacterium]|nr:two-component system sensor histidine kinase CreC [Desulfobacteraceae bacterium]